MNCEFCNTYLKSLSSLNYHKKTNQKCLEIQNINVEENCEFCNKSFTNHSIKKHLLTCKLKKKTFMKKIDLGCSINRMKKRFSRLLLFTPVKILYIYKKRRVVHQQVSRECYHQTSTGLSRPSSLACLMIFLSCCTLYTRNSLPSLRPSDLFIRL